MVNEFEFSNVSRETFEKTTNYSLTMHIIEIKLYVNKGNLLNVMFHVKHLWNPVVKRGIIVKHRKGK